MKKLTAIFFAVVLITVNFVVAFAADVFTCPECNRKYDSIDSYNICIDSHSEKADVATQQIHQCATCKKMYTDLVSYNECVGSHFNNVNYHYDKYVGLTIPELLAELVEIFNKTGTMETVQNLVDKLFELTTKTMDGETLLPTIANLEDEIYKLDLSDDCLSEIKNVIDELKGKLKCERDDSETNEVEVTEYEAPAETGSSASVSIAVFAAVSAVLAAAYVTTTRKTK
ncbi:MAG: hypothetical protein IJO03_01190 [Clostridia bacterium]|nr:hypothetical protein [Clostridia bacterium]MBQ7120855.1 hypothetical protein [Clostridia bacterium]